MSRPNIERSAEAVVACDLCSRPAAYHPELYYGRVLDRTPDGAGVRVKMSFSGPLLAHYCDDCVAVERRLEVLLAALLSVVFGIGTLLIFALTDFPREWTIAGLIVGGIAGCSVFLLIAGLFRSRERAAFKMLLDRHEPRLKEEGFGNFLDGDEFARLR